MKNLVNEMVKVLEGRNVKELRNEVEQLRKLSQENRSKLMRKEIEREMYNTIEKSIDAQIAAYKKALGENFPKFEIEFKSTNTKVQDVEHIEEMIADVQDDLKRLCKKRIEEGTGKYNEDIKRANKELRELEEKLAMLNGEEFIGEFEAIEATEEVVAAEEVVEVEEVVETNETFTNNTSIRVPKKCRKMIDCLYKDVEGYRIELKEGYVFETTECGVECVDTQKEVLDLIKNYIIRG